MHDIVHVDQWLQCSETRVYNCRQFLKREWEDAYSGGHSLTALDSGKPQGKR